MLNAVAGFEIGKVVDLDTAGIHVGAEPVAAGATDEFFAGLATVSASKLQHVPADHTLVQTRLNISNVFVGQSCLLSTSWLCCP